MNISISVYMIVLTLHLVHSTVISESNTLRLIHDFYNNYNSLPELPSFSTRLAIKEFKHKFNCTRLSYEDLVIKCVNHEMLEVVRTIQNSICSDYNKDIR